MEHPMRSLSARKPNDLAAVIRAVRGRPASLEHNSAALRKRNQPAQELIRHVDEQLRSAMKL